MPSTHESLHARSRREPRFPFLPCISWDSSRSIVTLRHSGGTQSLRHSDRRGADTFEVRRVGTTPVRSGDIELSLAMLVLPVRRFLAPCYYPIISNFDRNSATALLIGCDFIEGHAKDSRGMALDGRGQHIFECE